MKPFRPLSTLEQLVMHLREEILRGTLSGTMPGVHSLVTTLGTSPNTVLEALRHLEREGLVVSQGPGRRSKIVLPKDVTPPGLKIELLLFTEDDVGVGYVVELKHRLQEAGHVVSFSRKTLCGMDMDVDKIARYAKSRQVDAWVVMCADLPVLEWFATRRVPALGLFGRARDVDMPAVLPEKIPALTAVVKRLLNLGHRRISMLVREQHRTPQPSLFARTFLELLENHGIKADSYNLPEWEENAAGVCRCLDTLYQINPPTAILIDEAAPFMVARMHLAQRGIIAPHDISLVCMDSDPIFTWCEPAISHIKWNTDHMARRITQWAADVALGRADRRKYYLKAEFIEGGTIGPANKGR